MSKIVAADARNCVPLLKPLEEAITSEKGNGESKGNENVDIHPGTSTDAENQLPSGDISKQVANIQNLSGVKKDDQRTEAQSGDKNVQVNKADNDAGAQGNCSVS